MSRISLNSIDISWVDAKLNLDLIAYWRADGSLVYLLIDYCTYLSSKLNLDKKTIQNEVIYVKSFLEYLEKNSISILSVNDQILKAFRDDEVEQVKKSPNKSPRKLAPFRTVNAKLRRIYVFLLWLQDIEEITTNLIGIKDCAVTSGLNLINNNMLNPHHKFSYAQNTQKFPLLFRNVGENSKHSIKYSAVDEDKAKLTENFLNTNSIELAERNILIMEIANAVGFRRGSINSLCCKQFSRSQIENECRDQYTVIPPTQKFGYENSFDIPIKLALRIVDYIERVRNPFLKKMHIHKKITHDRIFLSIKNGKPLSDRTLSQIFGCAFKQIGKAHGAGLHSFRRKFANDKLREDLNLRVELGLDTSVDSMASSLAILMGQNNPESLKPYISREQGLFIGQQHTPDKLRIKELEQQLFDLKNELNNKST